MKHVLYCRKFGPRIRGSHSTNSEPERSIQASHTCLSLFSLLVSFPRFGLRVVGVGQESHCARVLWLFPGGVAETAGIRVGDKVSLN